MSSPKTEAMRVCGIPILIGGQTGSKLQIDASAASHAKGAFRFAFANAIAAFMIDPNVSQDSSKAFLNL